MGSWNVDTLIGNDIKTGLSLLLRGLLTRDRSIARIFLADRGTIERVIKVLADCNASRLERAGLLHCIVLAARIDGFNEYAAQKCLPAFVAGILSGVVNDTSARPGGETGSDTGIWPCWPAARIDSRKELVSHHVMQPLVDGVEDGAHSLLQSLEACNSAGAKANETGSAVAVSQKAAHCHPVSANNVTQQFEDPLSCGTFELRRLCACGLAFVLQLIYQSQSHNPPGRHAGNDSGAGEGGGGRAMSAACFALARAAADACAFEALVVLAHRRFLNPDALTIKGFLSFQGTYSRQEVGGSRGRNDKRFLGQLGDRGVTSTGEDAEKEEQGSAAAKRGDHKTRVNSKAMMCAVCAGKYPPRESTSRETALPTLARLLLSQLRTSELEKLRARAACAAARRRGCRHPPPAQPPLATVTTTATAGENLGAGGTGCPQHTDRGGMGKAGQGRKKGAAARRSCCRCCSTVLGHPLDTIASQCLLAARAAPRCPPGSFGADGVAEGLGQGPRLGVGLAAAGTLCEAEGYAKGVMGLLPVGLVAFTQCEGGGGVMGGVDGMLAEMIESRRAGLRRAERLLEEGRAIAKKAKEVKRDRGFDLRRRLAAAAQEARSELDVPRTRGLWHRSLSGPTLGPYHGIGIEDSHASRSRRGGEAMPSVAMGGTSSPVAPTTGASSSSSLSNTVYEREGCSGGATAEPSRLCLGLARGVEEGHEAVLSCLREDGGDVLGYLSRRKDAFKPGGRVINHTPNNPNTNAEQGHQGPRQQAAAHCRTADSNNNDMEEGGVEISGGEGPGRIRHALANNKGELGGTPGPSKAKARVGGGGDDRSVQARKLRQERQARQARMEELMWERREVLEAERLAKARADDAAKAKVTAEEERGAAARALERRRKREEQDRYKRQKEEEFEQGRKARAEREIARQVRARRVIGRLEKKEAKEAAARHEEEMERIKRWKQEAYDKEAKAKAKVEEQELAKEQAALARGEGEREKESELKEELERRRQLHREEKKAMAKRLERGAFRYQKGVLVYQEAQSLLLTEATRRTNGALRGQTSDAMAATRDPINTASQ